MALPLLPFIAGSGLSCNLLPEGSGGGALRHSVALPAADLQIFGGDRNLFALVPGRCSPTDSASCATSLPMLAPPTLSGSAEPISPEDTLEGSSALFSRNDAKPGEVREADKSAYPAHTDHEVGAGLPENVPPYGTTKAKRLRRVGEAIPGWGPERHEVPGEDTLGLLT